MPPPTASTCWPGAAPTRSCCASPPARSKIEEVALPFEGHIAEAFADPSMPGIAIKLSSWVVPPRVYAYDPATGKFSDPRDRSSGRCNPAKFIVSDLEAKAHDGAMVPLTLIQPRAARPRRRSRWSKPTAPTASRSSPTSVRARAAVMREGITYGICHVRGGGELGEAWRLGGKDANKHNTLAGRSLPAASS